MLYSASAVLEPQQQQQAPLAEVAGQLSNLLMLRLEYDMSIEGPRAFAFVPQALLHAMRRAALCPAWRGGSKDAGI